MKKLTVKAIRANLGMTQKEFSKAIGMTQSTYALKEQGKTQWKWEEILKISRLSDCDLNDISG